MNRLALKSTPESYSQGGHLDPYVIISPGLRMNWISGLLEVSSIFVRADSNGWECIDIGGFFLPQSPVNKAPISLISRIDLCVLLVASVDQYLLSTKPSKSRFSVVSQHVTVCARLFEYMWLQGFYRPNDMPREAWDVLVEKILNGGWIHALEIPRRTAALVSKIDDINVLFGRDRDNGSGRGISRNFRKYLGTNVRSLQGVESLLYQAANSNDIRLRGDLASYKPIALKKMKAGNLTASLMSFNRLVIANVEGAPSFIPVPGVYNFGSEKAVQNGRTPNLSPDAAARLLVYSFDWVVNRGCSVVDLLEDISEDLLSTIEQKASGVLSQKKVTQQKIQILNNSKKLAGAEKTVGKRILKFYGSKIPKQGEVGLLDLIYQIVVSCFVIIAFMNARRKDEIRHPVIGLHEKSLQVIDESLQLYQCEFYVEKTMRDYDLFWVTEISKRAIDIMGRIANVAWRWGSFIGGKGPPQGRDRKLFVMPVFAQTGQGYRHFEFASTRPEIKLFLAEALKGMDQQMNITPHMLRRGYGLIHHYRYENSELAALGRKYRHIDLAMPLHYVTNGFETTISGQTAAIWSAPQRTVLDARRQQEKFMLDSIESVGREKLELFVEDVIKGEKRFGGGFAKIVNRFNRFFSQQIDYGQLSKSSKTKSLTETLLSRGHMPHPYPHATCMAGQARLGAACAKNGALAREMAGPVVCGGCKYSNITFEHIMFMEEEVERLSADSHHSPDTLRGAQLTKEVMNVRRIIILQKTRLEPSSDE